MYTAHHAAYLPYPTPPAPQPPGTGRTSAFVKAAACLPAAAGTGFYALGRAAATQGAQHSIGDALLWGAIGAGSATLAVATARSRHSHPLITACCLLATGGAVQLGVASYATGWATPAGVAALFTLVSYAALPHLLRGRAQRAERGEQRGHDLAMRHMELSYANAAAALQAQGADYRAVLAHRHAELADRHADSSLRIAQRATEAARALTPAPLGHLTPQAQSFIAQQVGKHYTPPTLQITAGAGQDGGDSWTR